MEKKLDLKINAWLKEHLIPRLADIFQVECSINKVECSIAQPRGSFYLSDLFFADIRFPGKLCKVLVKLPPQDQKIRQVQNYNHLFGNEILFYEQLADGVNRPECYISGDDPVFEKVLVLENICSRGYFVSPKKVNVQLDYVMAGLRAIANFHACTYAMKEKTPGKFHKIVKKIVNTRYNNPPLNESFVSNLHNRLRRVTRALSRRNDCEVDFIHKISSILEDCFTQVMLKTVQPVEPLATIVHGDCTINNVMFRKSIEKGRGEMLEAMLIDFALMIYSSPAIDISTFIYLSCSREDIKKNTEKFIKIYHDCLRNDMENRGVWKPEKYSFKVFWEDYKKRAIFGYVMGAFFLAIMTEFEKDNSVLGADETVSTEINLNGGGETLTESLVDMLFDMYEAGFLDDFVNSYET
ncbi:hypothetical protein QAD02_000957 [Eretmocerus hayati]|uniref:Uncharacterized protein n=1 Tax=Eretmocerus hayati TaxID=131215 RepID=A0ACC2NEW0_9HYME|nr:hypothetical protein QAD02_000957 [Eretmocerus hayati]